MQDPDSLWQVAEGFSQLASQGPVLGGVTAPCQGTPKACWPKLSLCWVRASLEGRVCAAMRCAPLPPSDSTTQTPQLAAGGQKGGLWVASAPACCLEGTRAAVQECSCCCLLLLLPATWQCNSQPHSTWQQPCQTATAQGKSGAIGPEGMGDNTWAMTQRCESIAAAGTEPPRPPPCPALRAPCCVLATLASSRRSD